MAEKNKIFRSLREVGEEGNKDYSRAQMPISCFSNSHPFGQSPLCCFLWAKPVGSLTVEGGLQSSASDKEKQLPNWVSTLSLHCCPEIMDAKAISRKTIHATFLHTQFKHLQSNHAQSSDSEHRLWNWPGWVHRPALQLSNCNRSKWLTSLCLSLLIWRMMRIIFSTF